VRDANKQQLTYVYYENEPGRRSAAKLLTKDEARRIAVNIAKQVTRRFPPPWSFAEIIRLARDDGAPTDLVIVRRQLGGPFGRCRRFFADSFSLSNFCVHECAQSLFLNQGFVFQVLLHNFCRIELIESCICLTV
jgi:hypothetical protein